MKTDKVKRLTQNRKEGEKLCQYILNPGRGNSQNKNWGIRSKWDKNVPVICIYGKDFAGKNL